MFVPFISKRSSSSSRKLERRKGGGGGGRGGGGGGRGGGGSKGGSSSKSSSSTSSRGKSSSVPLSSGSSIGGGTGRLTTTTYTSTSARVPSVAVIPAGQPFAGRSQGGSGRAFIYGTPIYGSGYPGSHGRGTLGRGFPFFFWPLVWPASLGAGYLTYLIASRDDYGDPTNSTRPGGPLFVASFANGPVTFRLLADNFTVHSLVDDLSSECASKHLTSTIDAVKASITAFTDSSASLPRPESVIQYYRASSIALALDGYNNSATFSTSDSLDLGITPISGLGTEDWQLLNCLNTTIGAASPVVSAGTSWRVMGSHGVVGLPLVVGLVIASLLG